MTSISGLPISPASRRCFRAEKRRIEAALETDHAQHPAFATASMHARARSIERSTGFSQKIAFPVAAAR